jgi:hypothetical protein
MKIARLNSKILTEDIYKKISDDKITLLDAYINNLIKEKMKTKDILRVGLTNDQNLQNNQKIALNKIQFNGVNSNQLIHYDDGIKIGEGVSKVKITACIFHTKTGGMDYCWDSIKKNGIDIAINIGGYGTSGYGSCSFPTLTIDVKKDDVITLSVLEQTLVRSGGNTWLEVAVLE